MMSILLSIIGALDFYIIFSLPTTSGFTATSIIFQNYDISSIPVRSSIIKSSPATTTTTLLVARADGTWRDDEESLPSDNESLAAKFTRAVVLQRMGKYVNALEEYNIFLAAANSCDVPPEQYAKVHFNMGDIYTKLRDRGKAEISFRRALEYRDEMKTALYNLAVIAFSRIQEAMEKGDREEVRRLLGNAATYCERVLLFGGGNNTGNDDSENERIIESATMLKIRIDNTKKQLSM